MWRAAAPLPCVSLPLLSGYWFLPFLCGIRSLPLLLACSPLTGVSSRAHLALLLTFVLAVCFIQHLVQPHRQFVCEGSLLKKWEMQSDYTGKIVARHAYFWLFK
jgi:hypothetical protein